MRFDAIVHAPTLRAGARLNIAAADQAVDSAPQRRLGVGDQVNLRFGVCCPDLAKGMITDRVSASPETAVLAVGTMSWTIWRGIGGINDPGLNSETWFVAAPQAAA